MRRVVQLVRPTGDPPAELVAETDPLVRINLDDSGSPVYENAVNGDAMDRNDVLELILGADGVIVW